MKDVILISLPKAKDNAIKFVEFTHSKGHTGWVKCHRQPSDYDEIVYLGNCSQDGDMFAAYSRRFISIYKGHLNSGKY